MAQTCTVSLLRMFPHMFPHMSQHMMEQTNKEAWNALHVEVNVRYSVPLITHITPLWSHCAEKNQRQIKTDVSLLEVILNMMMWRTELLPLSHIFITRSSSGYTEENTFLPPASSKQPPPSNYLCAIVSKKKKKEKTWLDAWFSKPVARENRELHHSQLQLNPYDMIFFPSDNMTWSN